jgi:integrase
MFNEKILAKAEELKKRLDPNRNKGELIPKALVYELCDLLWAEMIRPTRKYIQELLNINYRALGKSLQEWRETKGLPRLGIRGRSVVPTNLEELRPLISSELHAVPLTCLDPANDGRWFTPSVKSIVYVGRIENQSLRDLCWLYFLLQADKREHAVYSHVSNFARSVQTIMAEQSIEKITDIDPNVLLYQVAEGKIGQRLSFHTRYQIISFWNRIHNRIDDYLEQLGEDQQKVLRQFQIKPVTDRRKKAKFKQWRTVNDKREERVKAKTAIIHNQFHKIRFMAEVRVNQTKRLFEATKEAIDYIESHNCALPHKFSYVEDTHTLSGRLIQQKVSLILWDRKSLFVQCKKHYISRYPSRSRLGKEKNKMLSDNSIHHSPEPSIINSNYIVELEGIDPVSKNGVTEPFWFLEMYRHSLFTVSHNAEDIRLQEEFNSHWGYDHNRDWTTQIGLLNYSPHIRFPVGFLQRKENRMFLPVEGLYATCLLAYLCVRVQTVTGARIGEVLQIAQNPECIIQLDNVGSKQESKWLLRLVPKGRKEKANYFIDAKTKDLLMEVVSYLRQKYKSNKIPVVELCLGKTPPDRYLLQWAGKGLPHAVVSILIRILLHGVILKEDGKALHVTSHLLRHAFATEMANLKIDYDIIAEVLHQKDTSVTKYYAQPTPNQIATAAEVLFVDRINFATDVFRNPEEIKAMLDDAQGKIGALTEVIGGTCTVANMCPVKFACIGCAGNAPDPKKRHQIERKSDWAKKQAKWAREENLLVEERQLENVQKDCTIILEEMDLIEKAQQDAEQTVVLLHEIKSDDEK